MSSLTGLPWPAGMYCSDDLARGIQRMPRDEALQHAYVGPNPRNQVWALIFDVDRRGASMAWKDVMAPPPNWTTTNPHSGHGHLGYVLATPVSRSAASRLRPLRLLARIQTAMNTKLGADGAYTGLITQTPDHPRWQTVWLRQQPYDLIEMLEWLPDELPAPPSSPIEAHALWRNVSLFDAVRVWAYRQRLAYVDWASWEKACINRADELNQMFVVPLPSCEVRSVGRSIAKGTWSYITWAGLSKVQAARGRKRGVAISAEAMDRRAAILQRCV